MRGRPDRAQRLVPGHARPPSSSTRCSRWPTSRTRRSARSARGGRPPAFGVRSAKSEFLPTLSAQAGWSGFTQQFTNENFLSDQTLSRRAVAGGRAASRTTRCAPAVGLGTTDCFAAAGLNSVGYGAAGSGRASRSATPTTCSPSATPASRSRRASGSRCRSSPASAARSGCRRRGRRSRTPTRAPGPAGSRCGATCTPATWACRRPTRRSPCRRPTARPPATSFGWRRTATGSAPGTSLEVSDAQNAVQRAEGDYVNAVYDYHKAIAALEAAVGRPLR